MWDLGCRDTIRVQLGSSLLALPRGIKVLGEIHRAQPSTGLPGKGGSVTSLRSGSSESRASASLWASVFPSSLTRPRAASATSSALPTPPALAGLLHRIQKVETHATAQRLSKRLCPNHRDLSLRSRPGRLPPNQPITPSTSLASREAFTAY